MEDLNRVRDAIKQYIMENGCEYDRLLFSESFYNKLKEQTSEEGVDFPRMEIKTEVDYDFKLLP